MHYHFSFYSSILLIFVSQGIVFAAMLLYKGITQQRADCRWLSLFVALCSVYLLPFMLGFAGWYSLQPYRDILFYLPLQQTLFIGPVLFFYTQCLLNPRFRFGKKQWLHFIPGMLNLLYSVVVVVIDKLVLHQYYFYANGHDKDFDTWYQVIGLISMVAYGCISLRYYFLYKKFILTYTSFADYGQLAWIRNCLGAFILMLTGQLVCFVLFPQWGNFLQKWWYYCIFGILQYYIALHGLISNTIGAIPFYVSNATKGTMRLTFSSLQVLPSPTLLLEASPDSPTESTPDNDTVNQWKHRLREVLEENELFKNPALSLLDVARELQTHPTRISKMVNKAVGKSFNDWVNSYRVQAVINMLHQREFEKQTLLGIALDCGFNSKSSFNRCFKKETGLTPQQFIRKLVPDHDMERPPAAN